MKEAWKTSIAEHYEVSNRGRVRRKETGRHIKQGKSFYGYPTVKLCCGFSKPKTHTVHSLVAKAFLPRYRGDKEINHIDGNKLNNCVDNLEAISHRENVKHAWRNGLLCDSFYLKESDLPNDASVGLRIKAARLSHGFTQHALGRAAGVSVTTVSAWECGRSLPSLPSRARIAKLLGVE